MPKLDQKRDKRTRRLEKYLHEKRNKKPYNGPTKTTMLDEMADYAAPISNIEVDRFTGRRGPRNTDNRDDFETDKELLEHLRVDAVEESIEKVRSYYENKPFNNCGLSVREITFAMNFIAFGFDSCSAMREILKDHPNYKDQVDDPQFPALCVRQARNCLEKFEVRKFIQQQINCNLEIAEVTANWVASKYKAWSMLDLSEVVELKEHRGRQIICLKKNLEDLPNEVRSAIRSISITNHGDVKIDLVDQSAALNQLSKMLGFANDKGDEKGETEIHLHFDSQDADA